MPIPNSAEHAFIARLLLICESWSRDLMSSGSEGLWDRNENLDRLQVFTSAKHLLGSVTVLSTVACGCRKASWWTMLCRRYCLKTAFTLKYFGFIIMWIFLSHLCVLRTLNGEYKSTDLGSSLPVLEDALLCSGRFSSGVSWEAVLLLLNMYSINVGFPHVS